MKFRRFPPDRVKALLLSRCSFFNKACQLLNVTFIWSSTFTWSQLGPWSSYVAYLLLLLFLPHQKVNAFRVKVHPTARGMEMTCGSHSDGNKLNFSNVCHLFCMQLAAQNRSSDCFEQTRTWRSRSLAWVFAAVIAFNSSHQHTHSRQHSPTKSHNKSESFCTQSICGQSVPGIVNWAEVGIQSKKNYPSCVSGTDSVLFAFHYHFVRVCVCVYGNCGKKHNLRMQWSISNNKTSNKTAKQLENRSNFICL